MTAALLLTVELARRRNGDCSHVSGGVLANDGTKHDDCSTCRATCGKSADMGLADAGFRIARTLTGLELHWRCPTCDCEITEATTLFSSSADAKAIATDPLCGRCRRRLNQPVRFGMTKTLYGLLDDEGQVIRWQATPPAGEYVTKEIKIPSRYELSAIVGDAPF